jgi:hypothetical protein
MEYTVGMASDGMIYTAEQDDDPFRNSSNIMVVGFEVSAAVVMKGIIFWDMTPCSPLSFN